MEPQLIAIFEGFAVRSGNWLRNPGNARLVEYTSRLERGKRDKLALVIEVLSAVPVPTIIYDRILAAFSGAYSRSDGTLTQALREGYDSANDLICDINRRADEAHQLMVGLQAAVVQDAELLLAQAGPVVAVLLHDGLLSFEPNDSPWMYPAGVNPANEQRDLAVGEAGQVEPHFSRVRLTPGDSLLLCNAAVTAALTDEQLGKVLASSHQGALAAVFGPLLYQVDAVGMMITIAQSPPKGSQETPAVQPLPQGAPAAEPVGSAPDDDSAPTMLPRKPAKIVGGSVLLLTALLIPLVLMVMIIAARLQYDRLRRQEFNQLRTSAQVQYETALAVDDPLAQRRAMNAALQRTEEGLLALPEDEELLSLRQRIINRLDTINNVSRLYRLTKLLEIDDPAMADSTSRVIVAGSELFLLNRGSNRVYHLQLNESGDQLQPVDENSLILQPGQQLSGIEISKIVDIVWMDADVFVRHSQLMALERSGSLVAYDSQTGIQGMSLMPVGDSDLWLGPQTIGKYEGNLYILDPLQSRILKYVPVDGAYTLPPTDYLDPMLGIDLTGVVDMAIDGNIYVLYVDGRVLKFLEGNQQPFTMNGLPSEMTSPLALCVTNDISPEQPGYVYVADTGSGRILQFDKAGNYIRQFMANPDDDTLYDLQAFYVDEPTGRLFMVADGAIWLTTLPPLAS
ncbi:MAG: hypothetical protein LLG44_02775 [Chloroflexi bacterium]|nr:hypothetical protein [Chloroflexota bacterium]